MGLEAGSFIDDLVITNPTSTDKRRQGDDHLRLIKTVLKASFPNVDGAVNPTPTEFNYVVGVTSAIQTQIDGKLVDDSSIAGNGLNYAASVLSVGAGPGIVVDADSVDLDISGLSAVEGNALVAADGFLVDNGGVMERMAYSDGGVPVETEAGTTDTLATANMNTMIEYTSASAVTVTLNTGVGKVGNIVLLKQSGAGQITVSGTATLEAANGTKTFTQHSVIALVCIGTDTWALFGDATT